MYSVKTRLIYPTAPADAVGTDAASTIAVSEISKSANGTTGPGHALSARHLTQHDKAPLEIIVVRIEVIDTGCGIRQEDADFSRLFSQSFSYSTVI